MWALIATLYEASLSPKLNSQATNSVRCARKSIDAGRRIGRPSLKLQVRNGVHGGR